MQSYMVQSSKNYHHHILDSVKFEIHRAKGVQAQVFLAEIPLKTLLRTLCVSLKGSLLNLSIYLSA